MQKLLLCDCGFAARAEDDDELVAQVQRHALQAHGMTLTRDEVLALASRAEPQETTTGGTES